MTFDKERTKMRAAELASSGVFIGTSSWKYEGWLGQLYTPARYEYRGKVAKTRFDRDCLSEYAEVFNSVCVDAAYYDFPRREYLQKLMDAVPDDFQFSFKVTDRVTLKKFPNLPRFGVRAGQPNGDYLNPDLFASAFVQPLEPFQRKVGLVIFEFSKFHSSDYAHGRDFVADLDKFLAGVPKGWRYGLEMRNKHFLKPEYFDTLKRHGVAHIFNSWGDMPPVNEQMALAGSITNPEFAGARFLLKPGRKYQEAVDLFSPYDQIKEAYPDARTAGAELISRVLVKQAICKLFLYVNNRLEGNALLTIMAMLEAAG